MNGNYLNIIAAVVALGIVFLLVTWVFARLAHVVTSAQMPVAFQAHSPQTPRHGHRTCHGMVMQIDLGEYSFCVPSTWDAERAVIQFEVFADGVLMRLEQADTTEAYKLAAVIKKNMPDMSSELHRMILTVQANSHQ